MDGLVKGLKSTFSAEGIGAALGIFVILAILAYFNYGPDRAASEVRSRVVSV